VQRYAASKTPSLQGISIELEPSCDRRIGVAPEARRSPGARHDGIGRGARRLRRAWTISSIFGSVLAAAVVLGGMTDSDSDVIERLEAGLPARSSHAQGVLATSPDPATMPVEQPLASSLVAMAPPRTS
jgi:hypothetical protein